MAIVNFIQEESSITNNDIIDFESNLKVQLPEKYKTLLLKFNGGIPDTDEIFCNGEKDSIGCFFSIKYGSNLIEKYIHRLQEVEKLIPKEYIPIADSEGGNIYCISTKEKQVGQIFGWFLADGETEGIKLANDIEEFLGGEIN